MAYSIKQLFFVLLVSVAVFRLVKPIALKFMTAEDLSRRRNVWTCLTVVAFLSPNFWVFVLLAAPILVWAARKDSNPVALYLLVLQVAPPVLVNVPLPGINGLIELNYYRLLSLCVLIPAAIRLRQSHTTQRAAAFGKTDALLLGWGILQTVLYIVPDSPIHMLIPDSITNMMRRAFLFVLDVWIVYYVAGRWCSSRRAISEALAAAWVCCMLMAGLAIFESLRHWLLYTDMAIRWGADPIASFYSMRSGILRAQVSAGHPLVLGYLLAVGLGIWLYLQKDFAPKRRRYAISLLLWLALLATFSRGVWFGAIFIYFAFAALGPRAFSRVAKAFGMAAVGVAVLLASPLGDPIIRVLPFMGGSVDSDSFLYRQRLLERTLQLIQLHPFFGDRFVYNDLEDLRQGQGIIDFVNTYAQVALCYGLVGLALFTGLIMTATARAFRRTRALRSLDPGLALLGTALLACISGTLLMIASTSFIGAIPLVFYLLAGLMVAYSAVDPDSRGAASGVGDGIPGSSSRKTAENRGLAAR